MLALLKNTMGVGLAANAALMSSRLCGWPQAQALVGFGEGRGVWMNVHFCGHTHNMLSRGTLHPRRPMFHITQSPSTNLRPMAAMPNALHAAV